MGDLPDDSGKQTVSADCGREANPHYGSPTASPSPSSRSSEDQQQQTRRQASNG